MTKMILCIAKRMGFDTDRKIFRLSGVTAEIATGA